MSNIIPPDTFVLCLLFAFVCFFPRKQHFGGSKTNLNIKHRDDDIVSDMIFARSNLMIEKLTQVRDEILEDVNEYVRQQVKSI